MGRIISVILIAMFTNCKDVFAQKQIYQKKFYTVYNVVFDKNYEEPIQIKDKLERIDLSDDDIFKIESILKSNLSPKVYKYYRCNGRQYLGYINQEKERKAVVGIYNNHRYPKKFIQFDKEFLVGFGEFYENLNNQFIVTINISNNKMEYK